MFLYFILRYAINHLKEYIISNKSIFAYIVRKSLWIGRLRDQTYIHSILFFTEHKTKFWLIHHPGYFLIHIYHSCLGQSRTVLYCISKTSKLLNESISNVRVLFSGV